MRSRSVGIAITVVWCAAFAAGFAGGIAGRIGDIVCLAVGGWFFVDLALAWRRERTCLFVFLRRHAIDIAFLVPLFRGLRLLRAVRHMRRLRRVLGALDITAEGCDIALTAAGNNLPKRRRRVRCA